MCGNHERRNDTAQNRAQRESAKHQRNDGRTSLRRRKFGRHGDDSGQRAAETDAGDQSDEGQFPQVFTKGCQQRYQAEQQDRYHQAGLASEPVCTDAEQDGAKQRAHEATGKHAAECGRRDVPIGCNAGRCECDDLRVESVHQRHECAQQEDSELKMTRPLRRGASCGRRIEFD